MSVILAPAPVAKFFDNDGRPAVGAKLFTYNAGLTTKVATYTDSTGATPNTNPIILNARAECNLWLTVGLPYKLTLAPSTDTDPPTNAFWTVDNIASPMTQAQFNALLAAATGSSLVNSTIIKYDQTASELAAGVTPTNYAIPSTDADGVIRPWRYTTSANQLNGNIDCTQVMKNVCLVATAYGNGCCIDWGGYTYQFFPGTFSTTDIPGDLNFIGNFSSLTGVEMRSSGAVFTSPAVINQDNVRLRVFKFTSCNNVNFKGMFKCVQTGDRFTGGANTATASERRGIIFARFVSDCLNIEGNLTAQNLSFGWWFESPTGSDADDNKVQPRDIDIFVKHTQTGYPLWCNRGGHNLRAKIEGDTAGRSCTLQDQIGGHQVWIKSKNHTASADVGISGDSDGGDIWYTNTESNTGTTLGRCIGINFPTDNNRTMRNNRIHLDIVSSGSTLFDRGFTLGLGIGTSGASISTSFLLENLTVDGVIRSWTNTMPLFIVEDPSAWAVGANLRNLNFKNLTLIGGGTCSFDIEGLIDVATLQNINCDAAMQLHSNNVSRTDCFNVTASSIVNAGVTSTINLYDCSPMTRTFTGTLTGMTAGTTGTVNYTISNNIVTLRITSDIAGTSNTTAMTLTGIPVNIQPAVNSAIPYIPNVENNGAVIVCGGQITGGTGTITFRPLQQAAGFTTTSSTAFTNSGTKGLFGECVIQYPLS